MKNNKIVDIVVNIVIFVILAIVLFLTINIIASQGKGYVSVFGKAFAVVQSDSMDGEYGNEGFYSDSWAYKDKVSGFKKGDIVIVSIMSDEEKASLEVGDVVTYYTTIAGQSVLNTHRIIMISTTGSVTYYQTQGDNSFGADSPITASAIIGEYTGAKIPVIGNFNLFIETTPGFIVCIVVPTAAILVYCVVVLVLRLKERSNEKLEAEKEVLEEQHSKEMEEMRNKIMQELLAKQNAEAKASNDNGTQADITQNVKSDEGADKK